MKMIAAVLLCTCSLMGMAQKEDYTWLVGYKSQTFDSTYQKWLGVSSLNFNQNPVAIALDSMGISFNSSNSMISDTDGNLLLSCNGVKVHNRFNERIQGADPLGNIDGSAFYTYIYPNAFVLGVPYNQHHIVLPNPINNGNYDIFHAFVDTFNVMGGVLVGAKKILRTTIDLDDANGHGSTYQKDVVVLAQENNINVTAVKHGNGRDWWICTNHTNSNCYSTILFNGTSSFESSVYCGGVGSFERSRYSPVRFSHDGSKFVSASSNFGMNVFSFDRCSGSLAIIEHVPIPELTDSLYWSANAIEFSPNGTYVYLFTNYRIFQYDLSANVIAESKKTVAVYNQQFRCPFNQTYYNAQLAPDGKIYVNSGNTNYCLAVINNPNEEGSQCNFVPYGVDLPNFISGLPHFPNYRLGALPGSACDTLTSIKDIAEKEKILKVFPNPANDVATIDYGYTDWSKGEATMEISNSLGQMVHSQALPMYSGFQKLQVGNYPSGSYTVYIKRKGNIVATGRLVKE